MNKRLRDYTLGEIKEFCESNKNGCTGCPFSLISNDICIMCIIDNEDYGIFYSEEW